MGQNIYFKTKHRLFRTKIYAGLENFKPPLKVMEVTFRRSGQILLYLFLKTLNSNTSFKIKEHKKSKRKSKKGKNVVTETN